MRRLYRFEVPHDNVRRKASKTDLDCTRLIDSICTKDDFVEWLLTNRPKRSSTQLSRRGSGTVCLRVFGCLCYSRTRSKYPYRDCISHQA